MDIVYKLFMCWKLSFLLGLCLGVELLGHTVTLGIPRWLSGKALACNAGEAGNME